MKKGIFITTLLAILGGIYWLFFYQIYFRTPLSNIRPLEAVPPQTSLILEFENYFQTRTALAKMPYTKEFEGAFFVKKLSEDLQPIRKVFAKTKEHRRLLLYSPLMASLQISDADDADFLYIIKDEKGVFQLEEILQQFNYKKFDSNGSTVYEMYPNNSTPITLGFHRGIILFSKYASLVENGMRQLKDFPSPLITDEKYAIFSKKIKDPSSVNVYLLFENLPAFAHPFMTESLQVQMKGFAEIITSAKLGLNFKKDGVAVDGFLKPTDASFLSANYFSKNEKEKSTIHHVLPDDVAYLMRADLPKEKTIQLHGEKELEVYEKYFQPWIGEEWSIGCAKIYTRRMQSEQFVAYHIHDIKKAQSHLQKFAEDFGELKSTTYMMYPIHQVLTDDLPIPIFGNDFTYIKNPYFSFIENYVVFAASQPTLENWIDKYITSQTLSNHIAYLEMENQIGAEGNWSTFLNTTGAMPLIQSFFKPTISGDFQNQIERFGKMQPVGFQLDIKDDFISTTGLFNYQEHLEKEVAHLWKTKLDQVVITAPSVHFNEETGEHQILIQDSEFKLHALNSSGEILWNVLLEDSIRSSIVAMDIFKKRKKHFIFNTKKNIVVLDMDGKAVRGFPLPLPDEASNGMSIVDFGERDYGMFVACKNGNVYGYNRKGIPIVGWNPVEDVGNITKSLQHFQYKHKDILAILNDDGDLMSFGKNGKKIMQGTNVSGDSPNALFFHPKKTDQMVVADATGSMHAIHVNGKNIQLNLKSDIPKTFQYVAADIAGDEQIDVAKLNGRNLEIFYTVNDDFVSKAKYQFPNIQHDIFSVGADENNKAMIGTLNKYQARIYLLDKNGNVHPAFPLIGTTPFQLVRNFNHSKNVVVVGNGNEVLVYEIQ